MHHVVADPQSGQVVHTNAGSCLELRFAKRGLGLSRWRVEDHPGHLVPLPVIEDGQALKFLVFGVGSALRPVRPLRLVRFRPDRSGAAEVRHVTVVVD